MNGIKGILTIILLSLTLTSCGQTNVNDTKTENYKVLAKLISFEGGDKIHFAKFQIIKSLSDSTFLKDTITVGYYNYKQPDESINTVLMTIEKYDGQTTLKNYFICPDYDGKTNIQKAKIENIDFEYWQNSETGNSDCKPLEFSRKNNEKNWFLIMPCGGTETEITVTGQNFSKTQHLFHESCPPHLDLSKLKDGNYSANMVACGLGGTINFSLTTTK